MDSLEVMACTLVASMLREKGLREELQARETNRPQDELVRAISIRWSHQHAAELVEAILADLPKVDAIGSRGPMP